MRYGLTIAVLLAVNGMLINVLPAQTEEVPLHPQIFALCDWYWPIIDKYLVLTVEPLDVPKLDPFADLVSDYQRNHDVLDNDKGECPAEDCRESLRTWQANHPNDVSAQATCAVVLNWNKKFRNAEDYKQFLDINRRLAMISSVKCAMVENSLACLDFKRERSSRPALQSAERRLAEIPEIDQCDPVKLNLAAIYYRQQKYSQAIDLLNKLLSRESVEKSTEVLARYALAKSHLKLDEPAKAIAEFEILLKMESVKGTCVYQRSRIDLAWLLAVIDDDTLRDGARAIELASKARISNKGIGRIESAALRPLAAAQAQLGLFDDAVKTEDKYVHEVKSLSLGWLSERESYLQKYQNKKALRTKSNKLYY